MVEQSSRYIVNSRQRKIFHSHYIRLVSPNSAQRGTCSFLGFGNFYRRFIDRFKAGSLVIFLHRLQIRNLVSTRRSTWESGCSLSATRLCTMPRWRRIFSAIALLIAARSTPHVRNLYVAWWFLAQRDRPSNHIGPFRYRHHGAPQQPIPGNANLGSQSLYNSGWATLS